MPRVPAGAGGASVDVHIDMWAASRVSCASKLSHCMNVNMNA